MMYECKTIIIASILAATITLLIILLMNNQKSSEGFASIEKSDAVLSPIKVMSTDVYSLSTPDHVILI